MPQAEALPEAAAVAVARARFDEAKQELEEAQTLLDLAYAAQRTERWNAEYARASQASLYATNPGDDERPYILPFGKDYPKWNPRDVENAAFGKGWLAHMSVLMCKRTDVLRTKPSRMIFTSGVELPDRDKIGQRFLARHDQTGAKLGEYEIVGILQYNQDGDVWRIVGEVPDEKFSQNTYK
jgi:hypothetical protein